MYSFSFACFTSPPETGTVAHHLCWRLSTQRRKAPGTENSCPVLTVVELAPHQETMPCLHHPLPSFSFTPCLVPGPSLHPPAPGPQQQPCTKHWQQKGSTDTADWPLLLYNPALKLFCEIHSFAILDLEICFCISFTCLHNSAHYQLRREHNGKITFGRKMFIILHCQGKKIVKPCSSFLLEKHERKNHTISNAIFSLSQPRFFCCLRKTLCDSVTAWLSEPYNQWAQLMHTHGQSLWFNQPCWWWCLTIPHLYWKKNLLKEGLLGDPEHFQLTSNCVTSYGNQNQKWFLKVNVHILFMRYRVWCKDWVMIAFSSHQLCYRELLLIWSVDFGD